MTSSGTCSSATSGGSSAGWPTRTSPTDERGGFEIFREGDELDIGASLEWRPEPWWAVVSVRDIYRFKAERLNAAGQLGEEPRTATATRSAASSTVGYIIDDVWTVRGIMDVRYVAANDYATSAVLYDGGRFKIAVGPGVTWTLSRTFAVDASVRWFYLDAERSPIFPRRRDDQRRARGHARGLPLLAWPGDDNGQCEADPASVAVVAVIALVLVGLALVQACGKSGSSTGPTRPRRSS